jgi:PPM family protein phosphatase
MKRMSTAVIPESPLLFDAAMLTHVGAVRTRNEDVVVYATARDNAAAVRRGSMALVADGMGGHAAGEVASRLAAEIIRRVYFESDGSIPMVLASAFAAANREIISFAARHPECAGMGTTCTTLALADNQAWLAHIGDSRAYLLRDGSLAKLSVDQTLTAQLVREGKMTEEEAADSPVGNVILQALGMGPEIRPLIWAESLPLLAGDVLVLCTDGLCGLVHDDTIAEIVGHLPPTEACKALVETALAAGGHDNISVGIVRTAADLARTHKAASITRRLNLAGTVPHKDKARNVLDYIIRCYRRCQIV